MSDDPQYPIVFFFCLFNVPIGYLVICYIAIENGPVEIVDLPIKNGGSFQFVMLIYQAGYLVGGDWFPWLDFMAAFPDISGGMHRISWVSGVSVQNGGDCNIY